MEFDLRLGVPGHHNALNAAAAFAAAVELGTDPVAAAGALGRYRGAARRLEPKGEAGGVLVLDSYAHHPTELAADLRAAREITGGSGRVIAVFQPHLYSRTRIFAAEFGAALGLADEAVVLDVYAAREDPEPGVTGKLIADAVPGGLLAGGTVSGDSGSGEFVPDGSVPGGPVSGESVPGDSVPGGSVSGGPALGGPVPGGSVSGGPVSGGPALGGPVPGDSVPGDSVLGGPAAGGPVAGGAVSGCTVHYVPGFADVPKVVAALVRPGDLVLTMGAGDITRMGPLVLAELGAADRP